MAFPSQHVREIMEIRSGCSKNSRTVPFTCTNGLVANSATLVAITQEKFDAELEIQNMKPSLSSSFLVAVV